MRKVLAALLVLCMLAALPIAAFADSNSGSDLIAKQPDYSKTGSISVLLLTAKDREPVKGGSLILYQVAIAKRVDGDNIFEFTPAFESCGEDLADLESDTELAPLAQRLNAWAAEEGIDGAVQEVSSGKVTSGTASFDNLALGLYLIAQKEPAPNCEPITPFLVTVPVWDEAAKELVYDVDAEPKCDVVVELAYFDPPIKKIVENKSGTAPADAKFTFEMTPGDKSYPMPSADDLKLNAKTGSMTKEITGPGEYEFGNIYYGLADVGKTYTYKMAEVEGNVPYFTYDTTSYIIKVEVTKPGDAIELIVTTTKGSSTKDADIVFTNIYDEPEDDSTEEPTAPHEEKLPQTGMLWWPVPVLLMLGLVLVAAGITWNRSRRFDKD